MLKRLFVKLPLYIITIIFGATLIIPTLYWVVTGKDYGYLFDYIDSF